MAGVDINSGNRTGGFNSGNIERKKGKTVDKNLRSSLGHFVSHF